MFMCDCVAFPVWIVNANEMKYLEKKTVRERACSYERKQVSRLFRILSGSYVFCTRTVFLAFFFVKFFYVTDSYI